MPLVMLSRLNQRQWLQTGEQLTQAITLIGQMNELRVSVAVACALPLRERLVHDAIVTNVCGHRSRELQINIAVNSGSGKRAALKADVD